MIPFAWPFQFADTYCHYCNQNLPVDEAVVLIVDDVGRERETLAHEACHETHNQELAR